MCGIAGIVGGKNDSKMKISSMLSSIRHRGPDGIGEHFFDEGALGHVRLSIVDIDNGKQPMLDENNHTCIVFNGEIYGYKEIREKLKERYYFKTRCDTEVLLALYHEYSEDMCTYLPGMFAFAIWDDERKRLFCGRDRFGEKPFYYAFGKNNEFIFASEIKAILSTGLVKPELDYTQVSHYFKYTYIYPTKTIYKNIYTLPPANELVYSKEGIVVRNYWKLPDVNTEIVLDDAIEQFNDLFDKAVRRQLISDVPVGAFLSGGLDSGSVVAIASKYTSELTTISMGFKEGKNELKNAATMSKKYKTHHYEYIDDEFDIADELIRLNDIFDEPFSDPAAIPARFISEEARKHVKVMLTGDGGDEILGGYDSRYRALAYYEKYRKKNYSFFEEKTELLIKVLGAARKFARFIGVYDKGETVQLKEPYYHDLFLRRKACKWLKCGSRDVFSLIREDSEVNGKEVLKRLGIWADDEENYRINEGYLSNNSLDNAIRFDLLSYLPGNGMVKTDRTAMSVGLECRTPFLDVNFAEFCISLPFRMKENGREEKVILRRAMDYMWTKEVRTGVKNGFSPPIHQWLNDKKVQEMIYEFLGTRGKRVFQIVNFEEVQRLCSGNENRWLLWQILVFSMWLETHICVL